MRILYKDKVGNVLVEGRGGNIGVKNSAGKYVIMDDFKEFVKENKLGNQVRFKKDGIVWVHNKLLHGGTR